MFMNPLPGLSVLGCADAIAKVSGFSASGHRSLEKLLPVRSKTGAYWSNVKQMYSIFVSVNSLFVIGWVFCFGSFFLAK